MFKVSSSTGNGWLDKLLDRTVKFHGLKIPCTFEQDRFSIALHKNMQVFFENALIKINNLLYVENKNKIKVSKI